MINLVGELKVAVKDHYSDLSMNTEFVGTDSIIAPHYNDLDNPVTEQELCDGLKLWINVEREKDVVLDEFMDMLNETDPIPEIGIETEVNNCATSSSITNASVRVTIESIRLFAQTEQCSPKVLAAINCLSTELTSEIVSKKRKQSKLTQYFSAATDTSAGDSFTTPCVRWHLFCWKLVLSMQHQ